MKLILLDKEDNAQLEYLKLALQKFQLEVYPDEQPIEDISIFVNYSYAIYLVVSNEDSYVGFTSFVYNTYYGLRRPTIGNTFIFVEKEYRRSKAMHLISIQAGRIAQDLGCPLEHYISVDSGSEKFVGRLTGKKIYTAYEFDLNEVKRETDRLLTRINIKE